MAEPWERYAAPTAPAGLVPPLEPEAPWQKYQAAATSQPETPTVELVEPLSEGERDVLKPYIEPVLEAFGQGFREGFGPDRMGISDENVKYLQDAGIFRKDRTFEPFKAFNELFLDTAVRTGEALIRGGSGLFKGGQAAAMETMVLLGVEPRLARDIAGMPEAFFGSPHPFGVPKVKGEPVRLGEPIRESEAPRPVEPTEPPRPSEAPDLVQARDLGVIGPERPRLSELTPEEAARAAVPPEEPPPPSGGPPSRPGGPTEPSNPWRERFDQFVNKLDAPKGIQEIIRDGARDEEGLMPARQGDIPLNHVESIAEVAGVDPTTIDRTGLGRLLKNDAQTRIAMRLMKEAAEDVKEAGRQVNMDASPENLMKLQETMLRRDLAVEQVVGLRGEWGRTGNVFQEFLRDVKDQESLSNFLKDKGRTPADLIEIAKGLDVLDSTQAARVLNAQRLQAPPSPFYWTWVNSLISGLLTHTKYFFANQLMVSVEHGVTTPIAALIGKVKEAFGAETDRVFFGEAPAATWGMIGAVPEAIFATAKSVYAGQRAVLKSEIELHRLAVERGEKVPVAIERAINQVSGLPKPTGKLLGVVPLDGIWGRIIGAPGDIAMGIHTFYKILGERASLGARAYRETLKEGLSPTEGDFWRRRSEHLENPSEDMQIGARADAYKGTFMSELGPHGRRWQEFTKKTPGLKWIFPFSHIPVNLVKATYEHTPLAIMDTEMRADITGKNGGVAQDKAIARMVVGSALMGYFVNASLNGRMTGNLPHDPKERDSWTLQNKQPNSVLVGNYWVSYAKFGPAGSLANMAANLAQAIPHLTHGDDEAMTKATWELARAAAKMFIDEVGFMSLAMMFEGMHDDKKGAAIASSQVASAIPFSSFLAQTASGGLPFTGGFLGDPHMREVKGFIDGVLYKIPGARETLLPKRDWTGKPVANPQYGNILRQRQANNDPVNEEMDRLSIHPAPPMNRIGGITLPPKMYDQYQVLAGSYVRTALENWVQQPGWYSLPLFLREQMFRDSIKTAHQSAAAMIQVTYNQIITQGIENRLKHIAGEKPVKKLVQ